MTDTAIFSVETLLAALVHGGALVFVFSAFGALLFLALVAPPAIAAMPAEKLARAERPCLLVLRASLALGILGEIAWLVVESADLASTGHASLGETIVIALRDTEFGWLVLLQVGALLAALVALGRGRIHWRRIAATVLAGVAVLLEAWHLHAAAMDPGPSFFLACEAIHVLAAGAWLGSLVPLVLFVRAASPEVGVLVSLRYSTFAKPLVIALIVTAIWQGKVLVGGPSALFHTTYGAVVLIKMVLFAILLGFALHHRYRMVPRLARGSREASSRALARSIGKETAFGVAIVLAAAVLASLSPPTMAAMAGG